MSHHKVYSPHKASRKKNERVPLDRLAFVRFRLMRRRVCRVPRALDGSFYFTAAFGQRASDRVEIPRQRDT